LLSVDRRAVVALLYTVVALGIGHYAFTFPAMRRAGWLAEWSVPDRQLGLGLIWASAQLVLLGLVPLLIVRLWHREPLRSVGWSADGLTRHLRVYTALFVVVLPFVYLAAQRADFSRTYPFVAAARTDVPTFMVWEIAYALTFVSLESFFRGYLLFTLAARMGWMSLFVMVVPYAMLHFGKPWPEAFAAIGAGLLLGALALMFRSFWGGVALHVAVAVAMDALAVFG
jgi:hypothetical protein